MFRPVNSRVNFPQLEENILSLWKEKDVFKRSVDARQGARRFMMYEGPPTANGNPGIHHVLSRIFKDIIPRYKAMKGYYTPRIAGWDTHGLPVELEVEREFGFSGKAQIEEYGVARFNARCRESVFGYLKEWEAMTERIGFWIDLDNAYVTMKNEYIETVWWSIKQMWDKGLVYQGYKVTPHCPRCGTSLSSHEVALGYRDDVEDPSVYIKFKVVPSPESESEKQKRLYELSRDKPTYLLAWTTTPWTLPGNAALAVAADADYALVEVGDEYLILASALLGSVGLDDCKVVARLKGSDLATIAGVNYEPLFNPHKYEVGRQRFEVVEEPGVIGAIRLRLQERKDNLTYPVIATDFVSMEEGTGIVHIAPAYGEVDYEACIDNDLDLVHTVDLQGKVIGTYPFSGKFVKEADPLILDDLESRGLLFRSETVHHTYPFCWRCEAPLLYYAKETWYIRTTTVKERLIAGNKEINWYPEHIKYGRFGDWLENNVDWAFSRERYWGTPLPVWRCETCGTYECIGSVKELESKAGFAGLAEPLDLHRPFVDELTFDCTECGAVMRRVPEVIDCWFDSGAMPISQWHYPFENDTLLEDGRFPADYICEAVDQTRGWFYSLHAISTLLFERPCFRNVICLGHILDAKGEKMSKARGNVVEPWAVIDKYGADALRWYFFTSSPAGNVRRFSKDMVAEVSRRFFSTLWNVYSFFVTYANIDRFTPESERASSYQSELDRWIISELNQLITDVDAELDAYNPTEAGRKIESFVTELSNWYVRRSRRRFWKSENDADKLSAYTALYECLVALSKLMAPFAPFLAEELYQNLVSSAFPEAPDSVHLADFPEADVTRIDRQLAADTRLAMRVSSLGRAARSQAGIKVRQPLAHVVVSVASNNEQESLERLKPQILEELNVKDLKIAGGSVLKPLVGKDNDGPGDAAIIRPVLDSEMGVIVSNGINPRYGEIDPYWMAASAIDEALRQIVAVGGNLRKVALLDNFCWGNTDRPEMLGALVRAAQACYDMAAVYETPFISGKDSLNNEFESEGKAISIPHTLLISAIGVMEDVNRAISMDFKKAGDLIYIVGMTHNELGGSEYIRTYGFVGNSVPRVNPRRGKELMESLSVAVEKGLVRACHDCSEGGIGVAVAEMAFAGGLGASISLGSVPLGEPVDRNDFILFSESNSRFLVEVAPEDKDRFEQVMGNTSFSAIGRVANSEALEIYGVDGRKVVATSIGALKEAWQRPLRW